MKIHYLEIVTPDVDAVCAACARVHRVSFGDADPVLGHARTAVLASGGSIGVRAPMHEAETPVIRPYALVDDIEAAVAAAAAAGAEIAVPPMELPGHGSCAVLIQGGVQTGLWQL
jgi:predicted enzyme related to lactoylglutathione lyase